MLSALAGSRKAVQGAACFGVTAVLCLAALAVGLEAQTLSFKAYGPDSGLSSLSVVNTLQDRTGYLWVATENGLFRYDGRRFLRFGTEQGLPSNFVINLAIEQDGSLWVGTLGGIARLRDSRVISAWGDPLLQRIAPGQGLRPAPNGGMFLATPKGLALAATGWNGDPKRLSFTAQPPATADAFATSVFPDTLPGGAGTIWFGCGKQLCEMENGRVRVHGTEQGVPGDRWQAIARDDQNGLWARSRHQIIHRPAGLSRFQLFESPDIGPTILLYPTLARLADGRLALPHSAGLSLLGHGSWRHIHRAHGLPISEATASLQTTDGSIWIGTPGAGLLRWLGADGWGTFTEAQGLVSSEVWQIAPAPDGTLWVAGAGGLSHGTNEAGLWRWKPYRVPGVHQVLKLAVSPGGDVVFTDGRNHLFQLDSATGRARLLYTLRAEVGLLVFDSKGALWLGSGRDLLRARPGIPATLSPLARPAALSRGALNGFAELPDGEVWLSSYNGIYRLRGDRWSHAGLESGLRSLMLGPLEPVAGGAWVSYVDGKGASQLQLKDGRLTVARHEDTSTGLPGGLVSSISVAPDGQVWFGTDYGISARRHGLFIHLGRANGLPIANTTSNNVRALGSALWVATPSGLAYHPDRASVAPSSTPPSVLLSSARLDNTSLTASSGPLVREVAHALSLQAGLTDFANEDNLEFRFRLSGGQHTSSVENRAGELTLPALHPDHYTLTAQTVRIPGGEVSNPLRLEFEVLPPWYATAWFRLVGLLCLAAAILLGFRIRARRERVRRHQLELEVARRTTELARERDLVHQKNEQIESLLQKTVEATRLKMEFLANTSHEIRTPMNAVLGTLALMLGTAMDDEQREYVSTAKTAADGLLALLDDVLDCSKISAGKLALSPVDFDLRQLLDFVVDIHAAKAVDKHLSLHSEFSEALPRTVHGDDARIRQILLNLLGNAIKFTNQGSVTLRVSPAPDSTILFEVLDTGIGIEPEHLEAIFEPFRQADGGINRTFGGTGLGLTICSHLVEAMGGHMGVESTPGAGSRFYFRLTLPAGETVQSQTAVDQAPTTAPERRLRVLVVEDNAVNRRLAARLLEKRGHEVLTVENGAEALKLLAGTVVDVVLMDIQMPVMDGLEATRRLRASGPPLQSLPVIGFTAGAASNDRQACQQAGMNGYISKPIEPAVLIATVERAAAGAPV